MGEWARYGVLMTRKQIVVLAVVVEAGLGGLALLGGWVFGAPMGEWLRWSMLGLGWGLAGAGALFGILALCRRYPMGSIGRLMGLVDDLVKPLFRDCRVLDLLLISVLAGIGEELLFRGLIQGGLVAWLAPWWGDGMGAGVGLVVASVLFGAAHWISKEYAIFATVMGMLLGWMAVATGDLLAPMVAHGLYDFGALVWLTRKSRRHEGGEGS